MKIARYGVFLGVLSIFFFFGVVKTVYSAENLDVTIVGDVLTIDSCIEKASMYPGYRGLVNGVEIFNSGPWGGYPCRGNFINLNNFYIDYLSAPFDAEFLFYNNPYFVGEVQASFRLKYDGVNYILSNSGTAIHSFIVATSTNKAFIHGNIMTEHVGAEIGFTVANMFNVPVYTSTSIIATTSGEFHYTIDYPQITDSKIYKPEDHTFTAKISKDSNILRTFMKTYKIWSPLENYPHYANFSSDTTEQIISSYNYIIQTLGNGLSGELTQFDLQSIKGTIVYGSRPYLGIYECDNEEMYIGILTNQNSCSNIYSGYSDDSSQVSTSSQSFFIDSLVLNPEKYYFFVTSGNNQLNMLTSYVGSTQDVVDGACYQQGVSTTVYIRPCNTVADLYFYMRGVTKSLTPPPPTRNPVLIIPGVLGTDILKGNEKLWLDLGRNFTDIGDQFMDPLQFNSSLLPIDTTLTLGEVVGRPSIFFDYTDGLVQEFQNQGYVKGINIFLFSYDWRYGVSGQINGENNNNVDLLEQKIQEIITQTGSDEVDIVAHSTGGLLVKKYVADNAEDNNIGKVVFVGVPNTGAPKAIKVLLQGDGFGIPWLSDGEMKKIAENLPVVYDLSPSQQYFNTKGSYVRIINQNLFTSTTQDLDFSQSNSFLIDDHSLNSQGLDNAHSFHSLDFDNFDLRSAGVDLYSINGCKAGTISKIVERRVSPIFGGINVSYDRPIESPGDGTVPLESSTNLPIDPANKFYALKADHSKMMGQDSIKQQIVNIISSSTLPVSRSIITQDIDKCKLNGKAISIYSPLDIEIIDQDGNHSGLASGGIENNIPNASFEIMGDHKFVYLPTDEGQVYTISLQGTGNGVFTLESSDVVDNQIIQTETFGSIPVSPDLKGRLELGDSTTLSLDANGDSIVDIELEGIVGEVVTLYPFNGFLQPINDVKYYPGQSPSVFKTGSTIPVKFQLKKSDGNIVQTDELPIWLTPEKISPLSTPVSEPVTSLSATTGNTFKWDSLSQQYIYNWSTKGLQSGWWYKISVKLDNGEVYSVTVGLR